MEVDIDAGQQTVEPHPRGLADEQLVEGSQGERDPDRPRPFDQEPTFRPA
jgi:hypothetical protein